MATKVRYASQKRRSDSFVQVAKELFLLGSRKRSLQYTGSLSILEAIAFIETALERPMPPNAPLPGPKPGGRAIEESDEAEPEGVIPLVC